MFGKISIKEQKNTKRQLKQMYEIGWKEKKVLLKKSHKMIFSLYWVT